MTESREPSIPEPALTPGRLLATAGQWSLRWGAIGFVLGAVGMFCIPLPYNDLAAQVIIKGPLGAATGALVGFAGGVVHSLMSHRAGSGVWAVGGILAAACTGGIVLLFWLWFALVNQ